MATSHRSTPSASSAGSGDATTAGRPGADVSRLGQVTVVALVAVIVAGLLGGAFAGLDGFDDGGVIARWGIPLTRTIHDIAAAATVGLLILAGTIVPERASTDRRGLACRLATGTGAIWTVGALVVLLLVVANTTGIALGAPGYWAQLGQVWEIEFFRVYLLDALLAAAVTVGAALARSRTTMTWLATLAIVAQVVLALVGHAAGAAAHDTAVNSLAVHLVAALTWLGTLLGLILLRPALTDALAVSVRRCSTLFLWCYAGVAVSGVLNAAIRLGSWQALASRYGLLVVAKLVILAGLGLAGWRMRSRLIATLETRPHTSLESRSAFWRLASLEVALMGAAVGIGVAMSRSVPPIPQSASDDLVVAITGYPAPAQPPSGALWLTTFRIDWLWFAVTVLAIGLYLGGVRRLRRRGDSWPWLRTACWVVGWLFFLWATNGAPGVYGRVMFSAHMLMHMSLAMGVPVILCLAAPLTLAARALPARRDKTLGPREIMLATAHSRWMNFFANPIIAGVNFAGSLYIFYFTPLFELALRTHTGMILMVVHFLLAGYVFGWALIGPDPGPNRWAPSLRLLLLFVTMSFHAFFGVALISTSTLLAGDYFQSLKLPWPVDLAADQAGGGALTWGFGEIPMLLLAIGIAAVWMRSDELEAKRRDRQADRDNDAELEAYNAELARRAEHFRKLGEG